MPYIKRIAKVESCPDEKLQLYSFAQVCVYILYVYRRCGTRKSSSRALSSDNSRDDLSILHFSLLLGASGLMHFLYTRMRAVYSIL